jgi:hypothetical protein
VRRRAEYQDTSDVSDAELESVRTRLDELANLEPDWNSYGGKPPARSSIAAAVQFMKLLARVFRQTSSAQFQPTSISPLPSGGIELEWRTARETVAVDVGPDGQWGYLRKHGVGRDAKYEERTGLSQDQLLPLVAEVIAPRISLASGGMGVVLIG